MQEFRQATREDIVLLNEADKPFQNVAEEAREASDEDAATAAVLGVIESFIESTGQSSECFTEAFMELLPVGDALEAIDGGADPVAALLAERLTVATVALATELPMLQVMVPPTVVAEALVGPMHHNFFLGLKLGQILAGNALEQTESIEQFLAELRELPTTGNDNDDNR